LERDEVTKFESRKSRPTPLAACLAALLLTTASYSSESPDDLTVEHGPPTREYVVLDHGPSPASSRTIVGEWTGLVPGRDALVTLRFDADPARSVIAITQRTGENIATRIHALQGVEVVQGRFTAHSRDGAVRIDGEAMRDFGTMGAGSANMTVKGPEGVESVHVDLFLWAGDSWLQKMLDLEKVASNR
jgi:hypothetical protein